MTDGQAPPHSPQSRSKALLGLARYPQNTPLKWQFGLATAAALVVGLVVTVSAGASAQTVGDVETRDTLIAAQENLANAYRCQFDVDTQLVNGGCADPVQVSPGPPPEQSEPQDIEARETLIAAQEELLNAYRCQFDVDTQLVPGGCPAATSRILADEVGRLVGISQRWDSAARVVVAVALADGLVHGADADVAVRSASAVKPLWTAAAIAAAGVDAVEPHVHMALALSDNKSAGKMIDLAGGIDAVNRWSANTAGLEGTHVAHWGSRLAASGLRPNLTTAEDLALFYVRLHQGELLGESETAEMENWLKQTPRQLSGVDGALSDRLPATAADEVLHKTGWLPPGCCSIEESVIVDAGLVPLPDGGWFAIALASSGAKHYSRSVKWVGLAACRIYTALSNNTKHNCNRPGDPPLGPDTPLTNINLRFY